MPTPGVIESDKKHLEDDSGTETETETETQRQTTPNITNDAQRDPTGNVENPFPDDDDIFYLQSLNAYYCGICKIIDCQHCPKKDIKEKKLPPPVAKQFTATTAKQSPSEVPKQYSMPKSKSAAANVPNEPELSEDLFLTPERNTTDWDKYTCTKTPTNPRILMKLQGTECVKSARKRVRNQLDKDTSSTVPIFSFTPNSFVDINHHLSPVNLMTANNFANNLFANITCHRVPLYFSSSLGNGEESAEEGELLTTRVEETEKTLLATPFPKDYVPKQRNWTNEEIEEEVDRGNLRFARIYMPEGCKFYMMSNMDDDIKRILFNDIEMEPVVHNVKRCALFNDMHIKATNYRCYVYRMAFYADEDRNQNDGASENRTSSTVNLPKCKPSDKCVQKHSQMLKPRETSIYCHEGVTDMRKKPHDLRTVKRKQIPSDNVLPHDDKTKGMGISSNDNRSSIGKSRIEKILGPTDTLQRSRHHVKPPLQTSWHNVKSVSDEQLFGQAYTLQRSQHHVKPMSDEQLFGQTDTLQRSWHHAKPVSGEQLSRQTDTLQRSQHNVKPVLDDLQSVTKCKLNF